MVTKLFLCCDWRGLNWSYDKTCQCRQMRGGTSDIWQCNYMVTSRYNTSTWVALCTLYIDTVSPDINRKGAYYYCSADGSRKVYWLPQLIPATNWKLLLSEQGHSWGYHQIENKHIKEVEIPSVSLNPSNPVLINSTIKFLFLNDRQDVEIRMFCGYWIVWESGNRIKRRFQTHLLLFVL